MIWVGMIDGSYKHAFYQETTMPNFNASLFNDLKNLRRHNHRAELIEQSLKLKHANLGPNGELIIDTRPHTGRSADDKYIVKNAETEKNVWWENNIKVMNGETFDKLTQKILEYYKQKDQIFTTEQSMGSSDHIALGVKVFSPMPSAILFSEYMFKDKTTNIFDTYYVLHAPDMDITPEEFGVRAKTVIVTCFERKTTLVIGTKYSGEIKKSMFSILNYLLPTKNILPMHSGANLSKRGDSYVFFGLSGTGKTTLSTDTETLIIGDDEHGLSPEGVFNFEGGCYAKTYKLGADTEPEIYAASTRFGSYLENVYFDKNKYQVDFFNGSETENGRSSYPLEFLPERVVDSKGPIPKDIFFLSADAFGVLPPLSRLTPELAEKYFVLGYTAKLAGTEIGVKSPKATFSPCFGAPFMLRHPTVYANILKEYLKKYKINVWLVNTGWYGGEFGVGERFPLKVTRDLIRAVQNHELDHDLTPDHFEKDEMFGFYIPKKVRSIDANLLNPKRAWKNAEDYQNKAKELHNSFESQIKKFFN